MAGRSLPTNITPLDKNIASLRMSHSQTTLMKGPDYFFLPFFPDFFLLVAGFSSAALGVESAFGFV